MPRGLSSTFDFTTAVTPVDRFFDCANIALAHSAAYEDAAPDFDEWNPFLERVREELAPLFGIRDPGRRPMSSAENITLFHNTTGAFESILTELEHQFAGTGATLLTDDLEFPDCIAVIDQHWTGPVVVAEVAEQLMQAIANQLDADEELHRALTRAFNRVRPRVIFLSHVLRSTGQVIQPRTLEYVRHVNPRAVIVLDGSQALGNVELSAELLGFVDYYVASGHKWLGGWTASGILWRREGDEDRPAHVGGTGNDRALVSLLGAVRDLKRPAPGASTSLGDRVRKIEQWNRSLGARFHQEMRAVVPEVRFVTPVTQGPPSGLVTVEMSKFQALNLLSRLKGAGGRDDVEFTILESEGKGRWYRPRTDLRYRITGLNSIEASQVIPGRLPIEPPCQDTRLRFCFHYYHEPSDVDALIESMSS